MVVIIISSKGEPHHSQGQLGVRTDTIAPLPVNKEAIKPRMKPQDLFILLTSITPAYPRGPPSRGAASDKEDLPPERLPATRGDLTQLNHEAVSLSIH